jgi:hypothetical protein
MEISANLAQLEAQLALLAEHWSQFSEAELRAYPGPGRWSKKEILGHLIDSATNNHRRFVLALVEEQPRRLVAYDQAAWVRLANYQQLPATELLSLWTSYNRLLLHLLAQIPPEQLAAECLSLNNNPVTLAWLIDDYVLHLEHHVGQIIHEQD